MNNGKRARIKKEVKLKKCKYCKATEKLTIDHKIPKVQGGTDETKNLHCLCLRCNTMKSGLSDRQVRRYFNWFVKIQKERVERGSRPYGEAGENSKK